VALKLGYAWDRWSRDIHRETPTTTESSPTVALEVNPQTWFLARASYRHAWRRGDAYVAVAAAQLPELRKYDQADRDLDRAEVLLQAFHQDLVVSASYGLGVNDYAQSAYGLQHDWNWSGGGDLSWSANDRVTLFGAYLREEYRARQVSRYRAGTQLGNLTYDWVSRTHDQISTVQAGVEAAALPEKLDLAVEVSHAASTSLIRATNPLTPTGGTAAQNTSATAVDYPELSHKLTTVAGSARFRFAANWSATVRYSVAAFRKVDFRTDGLLPATGADIFLGNDLRDYTAGVLAVTIGYNLGLSPPGLITR
jgi:hypothetical protein